MRTPTMDKAAAPRRSASPPIKARLGEALSSLTKAPSATRPTISSLCRIACVSRNTLYRYYPDVAKAVRQLRRRDAKHRGSARQKMLSAVRSEVAMLRTQLAKLAALADHYHAAAEEQRALVTRRDRELAALREMPQRRRACIPGRTPAGPRNTRGLTIVQPGRS